MMGKAKRAASASGTPASASKPSSTSMPRKDYFTKLPTELLILIADELDLEDRLKLRRLLPKSKQGIVETLVSQLCHRLYVSPTKASLLHYGQLCSSKFWQAVVTEVAFVARAAKYAHKPSTVDDYSESMQVMALMYPPKMRPAQDKTAREMLAGGRDRLEKGFKVHETFIENHIACVQGRGGSVTQESHAAVLSTLAKGLKMLPHLASTSIVTQITEHGLNMTPLWYSDKFASGRRIIGPHPNSEDLFARAAVLAGTESYQIIGQHVFVEAIKASGIEPEGFEVGNLVRSWMVFSHLGDPVLLPRQAAKDIAPTLTKLKVACSSFEQRPSLRYPVPLKESWKSFIEQLSNLQELTIHASVDTNMLMCGTGGALSEPRFYPVSLFAESPTFRQLRSLKIIGDPVCPAFIKTLEASIILRKHRNSLRELELNDILFQDDSATVSAAIQSVLTVIRNELSLDKFTMTVTCKDANCKEYCGTKASRPCRSFRCQSYFCDGTWIHRSELEGLAERSGIPLEEGVWHFEKFVNREG